MTSKEVLAIIRKNYPYQEFGLFHTLEKALTELEELKVTPTEQEVCEALSEYLNEPVWFDDKGDIRITTQWVVKQLGKYGLNFMVVLPPHLIELIGKFYKGKVKE